ncbi:MAG: PP2C family protein-serine/threonine phosphatase [Fusobacteriaceae bacterium]
MINNNISKNLNLIMTKSKDLIPGGKPDEEKKEKKEDEKGRKSLSKFVTSFISRRGDKNLNSDYFSYIELENFGCWVVSDGYDEDNGSELASQIIVEEILKLFISNPEFSRSYLKKIINKANNKLEEEQSKTRDKKGMNSSVAVVLTDYSSVIFGTVGNSRVYILKDDEIMEKSQDDSLAHLMYEGKEVSYSEIRFHNQRNKLTQNMGDSLGIKPNISKKIYLLDSDKILLMTHGTWEQLDESEIEIEVSKVTKVSQLINKLDDKIKNNNVEKENYTVVGIFADKVVIDKKKIKFNWLKIIGIISLIIGLMIILYRGYSLKREREKIYEIAFSLENEGIKKIEEEKFSQAIKSFEESKIKYRELEINPQSNFIYRTIFSPKITNINLGKQILFIESKLEEITKLQESITLVNDGDLLYQEDEFIEAEEKYEDAKIKITQLKNLNYSKISELNLKIEKSILASKGLNIGKEMLYAGDELAANKEFEVAISNYSQAKLIFLKYDKISLVSEVSTKINKLSKEKERKYNQANEYEKKGYELESKDIEGAIIYFENAKGVYTEIRDEGRRTSMEKKIENLNETKKNIRKESIDYIRESKVHSSLGEYEKALIKLKKSQDISLQLKDNQMMVDSLLKEGDILWENNKSKLSLEKYKEAYTVSVNTNDDIKQGELKEKIELAEKIVLINNKEVKGDGLYSNKKYKESRKEFLEAIEELKKIEKNKILLEKKYNEYLKVLNEKENKAWKKSNWIPFY